MAAAVLAAGVMAAGMQAAHAQEGTVRLHAAGSLRSALTELGQAFTAAQGIKVQAQFGASGLLRQRLDDGEPGDVYASADMGNPQALARAGKAWPVVVFARNRLCALVRPGLDVMPGTILTTMLAPGIRLATSTPGNDPAGDYAWQVFARAEQVQPSAQAALQAKALKLTGAADALLPPPPGRSVYAWHLLEGRADLFLAYCTAGREAAAEAPGIGVVELPPALAVGAEYGLTALRTADAPVALPFVLYVLSAEGQAILARYGFGAPLMPR
jgi:molybdate transport system substrate-binding protein